MKQGPEEPISNPGIQTWESSSCLVAFSKTRRKACPWVSANALKDKKTLYVFQFR